MSPAHAISPATRDNLDLLRAILVLQVILGHLVAMSLPKMAALGGATADFKPVILAARLTTRFGPQAAVIFVVLSGFLVGGPLLQQRLAGAPPSFSAFAHRRLARLWPTLAGALLLTALLDFLGARLFDAAEIYRSQHYDFIAAATPIRLLGNFLGLQPTIVDVFGSNGPLWTLGYIIQFYLIGFMTLCWAKRFSQIMLIVALMLAATASKPEWLNFFAAWLAGAALTLAPPVDRAPPYLALGLGLLVAANLLPGPASTTLAAAAGLALIRAAQRSAHLPEILLRPATGIAHFSFEIYAVHYPIGFFLFAALFGAPANALAPFLAFLSLAGLTIVALAWLLRRMATLKVLQPQIAELST